MTCSLHDLKGMRRAAHKRACRAFVRGDWAGFVRYNTREAQLYLELASRFLHGRKYTIPIVDDVLEET